MTVTLVTGATRGLGLETVRRLVQAGHTVYLGARDAQRGDDAAASVGARTVQLDVTDDASVTAAVDRLRAETGVLDVLVNNAGIGGRQDAPGEATIDDLEEVLATNVVGATRVLAAFAPLLDASDAPVVVNVSSTMGSLQLTARPDAPPAMLAYPMSKAALNMLTIEYARSYPRWRVNSVTPGLTATDFTPATAQAGGPVEENAEIIVRTATCGGRGPTGGFLAAAGPVPW